MSLLYPIFIYLMLPLTLILFYFVMTGAKESFSAFDKDVLDRLRHENKSLSKSARNSLFLVSFIFMILALSQPVIKDGEIVVEAKSADILIGIDISDSMKAEDRYPNRLEFAKAKAIELIKVAPHNRMGVLAFAKHDYIVSPLSFDHSSVAFLLSKVNTKNITEKGTRLDSMLHSAIAMLEHADMKNLLLFTDGGDSDDFSKEIELAKENGLRLFIIGVGTSKGSPVKSEEGGFVKKDGNILISKLNNEIQNLATQTGGVYIESVLSEDDIKAMLKEIESITEKSTLKKETIPQYTQLFYYPLALALFFLFLAFISLPKSVAKNFSLILFAMLGIEDARAGLLDFKELNEAKQAYLNEDYTKSASIYKDFAVDSPEAVYNLGNSLYKNKEYENALRVYDEVSPKDDNFKAMALHNSGNTHVKLEQYEEALKSYEKSLALKEDKETKENYEAVKKFLEEQKQEDKEDQENQDKDQDKQDENKDKNKDQESKDKEDSDKQDQSENTDEKEQKNKDKKSEEKDQQKSEQDKQEKESKEKETEKDNKNEEKTEEQKQKSEEKKEDDKTSKEKEAEQIKAHDMPINTQKMSDLEAKKWVKLMQESQKGHLYKMQEAEHKEDSNEKPW